MSNSSAESAARLRRRPPGLLLHPELSPDPGAAHTDYFTTILHYGTKVAGLQILPSNWVPLYVALPAWICEEWTDNSKDWVTRVRRRQLNIEQAIGLVSEKGREPIIIRSSAVGEGLEDRGLYKSIQLPAGATFEAVVAAIEEIFLHFAGLGRHTAMGICMQRYMPPDFSGHVSNEAHLSATRNQWKYGIETPAFAPDRGLNSKFAHAPDENVPLTLSTQKDIAPALRRVCNWVNLRIDGRSHLEWCGARGRLWIVQLDQESPTSGGVNPHIMPEARGLVEPSNETDAEGFFKRYRVQEDPPWRKLRNIRDFWTGEDAPRHRLYFATGEALAGVLAKRGGAKALAKEIDALTGGRAVLRTDCKDPEIKTFNLPRTHTVDGAFAAGWIKNTLAAMAAKEASAEDIAIILHRYIPARAAAWSYYSPGEDFVRIDCLWGLPDGLQFLSHDSFQIDARTGEELAAQVRYKPDFLQEQDDGTWRYVAIARQYGRDRVLSREALRIIAQETVAIARNLKERTQIMWFCDLPPELGLGLHLPWYRSKEFVGYAEASRPALPTRRVRNLEDLDLLERDAGRFIILATPDVELVRDDDAFLDRLIALANARDLPVELSGSILGHAYYRLRAAGVVVLVPQPKYPRVRGLHRHFKVVRDAIPQNIAAKGERVSFGRLASSEALVALIGKLFEEGLELNAARAPAQRLEELADVLEVVRGLAITSNIGWDTLIEAASEKREKRGGFEQQTVLLETARPMPGRTATPAIAGDDEHPSIQLRDLGAVSVEGAVASISFSKLLSFPSIEVELAVDGRQINVTAALDGTGLRLFANGARDVEGEHPDTQLGLFDPTPSRSQ
jgi:predicted house-cleaning noncanonical NTP pyrophosphatase (MazG superfamily)